MEIQEYGHSTPKESYDLLLLHIGNLFFKTSPVCETSAGFLGSAANVTQPVSRV